MWPVGLPGLAASSVFESASSVLESPEWRELPEPQEPQLPASLVQDAEALAAKADEVQKESGPGAERGLAEAPAVPEPVSCAAEDAEVPCRPLQAEDGSGLASAGPVLPRRGRPRHPR